MKDHIMSKKHDRHSYKHSDQDSRESNGAPHRYKNILKERHYKDEIEEQERNKRKDRDRNIDSKHSSHSHKSKKSYSPHRHSHHKSSTEEKGRKHRDNEVNESYEELSRRKRKLESELRALDMEEAAEREAENKKTRREKSKYEKKYVPEIKEEQDSDEDRKPSRFKTQKAKEEQDSDEDRKPSRFKTQKVKEEQDSDEDRKPSRFKTQKVKEEQDSDEDRKPSRFKTQTSTVKIEKDRHKNYTSKSSSDEKERGWGKSEQDSKTTNKEKPNFAVSGKLAEDTNTYNGIVIKYNEPAEARKPKRRWRLYPFKGDSDLPFIPIHRQSAYLFGRTRLIADIPIDHPSCSKQHAVLQFRLVSYKREDGTTGKRVRPYIIDLESSNGTYVNNNKIDPRCYVELIEKDVVKFGFSSREYVLLHEESKNDDDDDVLEAND